MHVVKRDLTIDNFQPAIMFEFFLFNNTSLQSKFQTFKTKKNKHSNKNLITIYLICVYIYINVIV